MKNDELLPCPFCGGVNLVWHLQDDSQPNWHCWIECGICGMETDNAIKEEVIQIWNTRFYESEISNLREKLRERDGEVERLRIIIFEVAYTLDKWATELIKEAHLIKLLRFWANRLREIRGSDSLKGEGQGDL